MNEKYKNCILSLILNLTIIAYPFVIAIIYNEQIQEKTLTIALAMFLLNVGINTSDKLFFFSTFIIAIFLVGTYGAIKNDSYITSIYFGKFWLFLTGLIILIIDKYDLHVRKGQPLNNF